MAEIRIEKKKPIWPWLVGVVLLLLVAGAIILFSGKDEDGTVAMSQGQSKGSAGGKTENSVNSVEGSEFSRETEEDCVAGFNSFVQQHNSKSDEQAFNNYMHNGLEYLSCSLDKILAQNNINDDSFNQKNETIFETAQTLKRENESNPSQIKAAFDETAELLENIQQRNYPELQKNISEVKTAANNFRGDEPTLQQKEAMELFFEKTSETLSQMHNQLNARK